MTDLAALKERLQPTCWPHDWPNIDGWGVVLGATRCRKCGKLATREDFPALLSQEQERAATNPEGTSK